MPCDQLDDELFEELEAELAELPPGNQWSNSPTNLLQQAGPSEGTPASALASGRAHGVIGTSVVECDQQNGKRDAGNVPECAHPVLYRGLCAMCVSPSTSPTILLPLYPDAQGQANIVRCARMDAKCVHVHPGWLTALTVSAVVGRLFKTALPPQAGKK
jgi:hypothetical protein